MLLDDLVVLADVVDVHKFGGHDDIVVFARLFCSVLSGSLLLNHGALHFSGETFLKRNTSLQTFGELLMRKRYLIFGVFRV